MPRYARHDFDAAYATLYAAMLLIRCCYASFFAAMPRHYAGYAIAARHAADIIRAYCLIADDAVAMPHTRDMLPRHYGAARAF